MSMQYPLKIKFPTIRIVWDSLQRMWALRAKSRMKRGKTSHWLLRSRQKTSSFRIGSIFVDGFATRPLPTSFLVITRYGWPNVDRECSVQHWLELSTVSIPGVIPSEASDLSIPFWVALSLSSQEGNSTISYRHGLIGENCRFYFHWMTSMVKDNSWSGSVIFFKTLRDTTIAYMLYCNTATFWTGIRCIHLTSTCTLYRQSCIPKQDTKQIFWDMYFQR